jgi:hypothetical protein
MWTQVLKTSALGAFGILLFVHGAFIVSDGNLNVSEGDNVVGGFIYMAVGSFIVALGLSILAFRIWLFRRVKAINATE